MVRIPILYVVPTALIAVISLLLTLTRFLLEPLYNSLPLNLHPEVKYATLTIFPALVYWHSTIYISAREVVSPRVCLSIAAIGGDIVVVSGRTIGSITGKIFGAEWGTAAALAVLGVIAVGGGSAFMLLCFDHIYPVPPIAKPTDKGKNLLQTLIRSGIVVGHVWTGEQVWRRVLAGNVSTLVQRPEKSILFISILLTAISLFMYSPSTEGYFSRQLHKVVVQRFKLRKKASRKIWNYGIMYLPKQVFPVFLLLRLPLLILALRQQLFLRPPAPYLAAHGALQVLSSQRSVTGQIVVADNLQSGYRYLRCDASILGGKWIRSSTDAAGAVHTDMGDSIFATFALQEVALLAAKHGKRDTLAETIAMTTGLQVKPENSTVEEAAKVRDRALIIGLGVGIAAQAFSKQHLDVDIVEIDPAVYEAAVKHFDLSLPESTTVSLADGAEYIHSLAKMQREGEYEGPTWKIVVQDCFSGGMVPGELFTLEFWRDLKGLMDPQGFVTMNFVGLKNSKASRAVLLTLSSVFTQCRAFGDSAESARDEHGTINMVVICTPAESPLLTFRKPTARDVRRSPLRSHVYSTFLDNEISLDSIIREEDWNDEELLLRQGDQKLDNWQVETALGTWRAMQQILTPDMWLAY